MNENKTFEEGDVVICGSGQAGTIIGIFSGELEILTRSCEIWRGPKGMCRHPQSQEDLDSCPIVVERPEPKIEIHKRQSTHNFE